MKKGANKFFDLWINWKAQNINLYHRFGKVAFEYFVFERRHLVLSWNITWIMKLYPEYFE